MSNGRYASLTKVRNKNPNARKIHPPSSDDEFALKKHRKVFVYDSPVATKEKGPLTKQGPTTPSKILPHVEETEDITFNDFDSGLIDISLLKSSPIKPSQANETQLNAPNPNSIEVQLNENKENDQSTDGTKEEPPSNIDNISIDTIRANTPLDILNELAGAKPYKSDGNYKGTPIPTPITSKRQLLQLVEALIPTIKQAIQNDQLISPYYELAKLAQEKSVNETMSSQEKLQINWDEFTSGYFGINRQLIISSIIQSRCRKELQTRQTKNKVIRFWTIEGFSTYVLANEIAISLAMEDMNYTFDEASQMLQNTVDHGKFITDRIDIIDDLLPGELLGEETTQFMQEFSAKTSEKSLPSKRSACQSTASNRKKHKSLLEQLVDSESDGSDDSQALA